MGIDHSGDASDGSGVIDGVRNVVRVKLTVIVDQEHNLIEWKCTGVTGVPPRMTALHGGKIPATSYSSTDCDVMCRALRVILEEHTEPF